MNTTTLEAPSQQQQSAPPETPLSAPQAKSGQQDPAPELAPSDEPKSDAGGDWRMQLAGEDSRAMEQLARYKTPADFWKSHSELRTKLSERPQTVSLAADATPEQIAEYRSALGIEEVAADAAPEAYLKALGVDAPATDQMSEMDVEMLHGFAKTAYDKGHDPRVVKDAVGWYFEQSEAIRQAHNARNGDLQEQWQSAMKEEFGREYKPTIEAASAFLKSQVEDEATQSEILNAQMPGGGRLGDHPAFAKMLVAAAMNSGLTDRIEASSMESGGKSLGEQQSELEGLRTSNPEKYNAKETQARLDKIIGLRLQRGEIDEMGNEIRKR